MQLLAEYFNNYQEIKIKKHYSKAKYVHKVFIKENTLLANILKEKVIFVNSRHKYAIPYTSITINALSQDNIIEGVEDSTKKFFLGLQWHPENLNDQNSYLIFSAFINSIS